MADKTFGFKVTTEVKALQTNAPKYKRNLNELELHTTRIYELVVNMMQQSMYFKNQDVYEVSEQQKQLDEARTAIEKSLTTRTKMIP